MTSSRFQDFVEKQGDDFSPLSDDLLKILDTPSGKDLLEKTDNLYRLLKQGIKLKKKVDPMNVALLRENWKIAKAFSPDLILYHPKSLAAPHIAEKLGSKIAFATPIPLYVPTTKFSFVNFPKLNLGPRYNLFSFHMIKKITEVAIKKYVNNFRDEIGLPPTNTLNIVKTNSGEDITSLHLHSNAVLPRPLDWPSSAYVTGYCFLDEEEGWKPSRELEIFLASGPPPIYIGFGSMAGRSPEKLAKTVTEALVKTGYRGIIATGWGGLRAGDLPETIFQIDHAPHHWLLPKVSAVIHHGGAGTTAAGLRAGKPTLIIPFFGDQPFWGNQVYQIGAGPKPIRHKKLNVDILARAMVDLITNQSMRQKANEIGQEIRNENGVKMAVSIIENLELSL